MQLLLTNYHNQNTISSDIPTVSSTNILHHKRNNSHHHRHCFLQNLIDGKNFFPSNLLPFHSNLQNTRTLVCRLPPSGCLWLSTLSRMLPEFEYSINHGWHLTLTTRGRCHPIQIESINHKVAPTTMADRACSIE